MINLNNEVDVNMFFPHYDKVEEFYYRTVLFEKLIDRKHTSDKRCCTINGVGIFYHQLSDKTEWEEFIFVVVVHMNVL